MNRKDSLMRTLNISTLLLCGSFVTNVFVAEAVELDQSKLDQLDLKINLPSSQAINLDNQEVTNQNHEFHDIVTSPAPSSQTDTLSPYNFNRVASLLAQTTPKESSLEGLNPSEDDLNLPTTTEEVTINVNKPITIEEAIDLALTNNRDLQEAELNVEVSRKQLDAALAARYPSLAVQGTGINSNTASAELGNEQLRENNPTVDDETLGIEDSTTSFNADLTLNYDVYTGGGRGANIRLARKQLEINELALDISIEQTIFETKEDYYDLQDASSQVDIAQAAVDDASQTLKDAQLLEEAGLGTKFDVLRAEVELANAEQSLNTSVASRDIARRQLVETLSLGEQVDLQTADEIVKAGTWNLSLEESIITAYGNRQELIQFLLSKDITKEQRKIALAAIRPTISVFGQVDAIEVLDDDINATTGYTVGATASWTIFDGGTAKANARAEDINSEIAENNFADQRNNVKFEVEQAFFGLQANDKNIVTAEKAVELAEESLRLARLRFQAGVGTQTDVIEAQTELTTARGNLLGAIINYNQSLNQLDRSVTSVTRSQN